MMAPACPIVLPGGAVKPAMYATTGFVISGLDELRRLLLLGAADLPDHDDVLGLGVLLEAREDVQKGRSDHGVPPNSDDSRLTDTELRQLVPDLVRERAGSLTRPTLPSLKISAGMIPTFALPGESTPGQFGPTSVIPRGRT